MEYLLPALILCAIVSQLIGRKRIRIIYLQKLILPFLCVAFLLCLMLFSKTSVKSASNGIQIWLTVVFPSLFPFFVATEILNKTNFVRAMGILLEPVMRPLFNIPGCGSFAFIMGITSGYPVGAKITTRLRDEKLLTKTEAERLISFTNNSGPLFILGAVATGMLNMPKLGFLILACHILSCITVGFLFRFYKKNESKPGSHYHQNILRRFRQELFKPSTASSASIGELLGDAIRNSIMTLLAIGGFIILFSVIINLLLETGFIAYLSNGVYYFIKPSGISKDLITALISGFFEITTGCKMACSVESIPVVYKITALSMIIGWAGLSVHTQVLSIASKSDISIKPYFLGKFLQGCIASLYSFIAFKLFHSFFMDASYVFSHFPPRKASSWGEILISSSNYLLLSIVLLIALTAASMLIYQFKKFQIGLKRNL